jgi:cytochrome c553
VRRAASIALLATLPVLAASPAPAAAQAAGDYAKRWQAVCAACHGERGQSTLPLVPSIGGQPSFYVATQLFLFREGRRNDHPQAPAMSAIAKDMDNTALRGWSDFVATLPPPARPGTAPDPERMRRGRALAEAKHCLGCHGRDLAGGRNVPRVAHQREDYLQLTLKGFRSGLRVGYTGAMSEAVAGLAPQDLDDLAHFLAHAPPP